MSVSDVRRGCELQLFGFLFLLIFSFFLFAFVGVQEIRKAYRMAVLMHHPA